MMTKSGLFGKWGRLLASSGIVVGLAFALSACNTVEGVGKDVKGAGAAIEKTADKSK